MPGGLVSSHRWTSTEASAGAGTEAEWAVAAPTSVGASALEPSAAEVPRRLPAGSEGSPVPSGAQLVAGGALNGTSVAPPSVAGVVFWGSSADGPPPASVVPWAIGMKHSSASGRSEAVRATRENDGTSHWKWSPIRILPMGVEEESFSSRSILSVRDCDWQSNDKSVFLRRGTGQHWAALGQGVSGFFHTKVRKKKKMALSPRGQGSLPCSSASVLSDEIPVCPGE